MDEFFIGYEPMPPRLARRIKVAVVALAAIAIALAALAATGFRRLPASTFEFGTVRAFEGRVVERPYAALELPAGPATSARWRSLLLVAPGKFGARPLVEGLGGRWVRLHGTRIERAGQTMVEVEPGSVEPVETGRPTEVPAMPGLEDLGRHTLRGEIVDSKCFLGVMNPGDRQVHRDCAIRCISGGIPPLFVVRGQNGREWLLRPIGEQGEALGPDLLDLAGIPVEVSGTVLKQGDWWWLRARAQAYRALRP